MTKAVKRDFRNLIVDGEIVVFKGGKPDFASLKTNPERAVYIAFDLLYLNDQALLEVPLVDRRYELFRAFAWNHLIYFSEALEAQGRTLFELVRSRDRKAWWQNANTFYTFPESGHMTGSKSKTSRNSFCGW